MNKLSDAIDYLERAQKYFDVYQAIFLLIEMWLILCICFVMFMIIFSSFFVRLSLTYLVDC